MGRTALGRARQQGVDTADRADAAEVKAFSVTGAGNVADGCWATNRGHCCRTVGHTVNACLVRGGQRVASGPKKATNVSKKSHTSWGRETWRGGGWMDWSGEGVSAQVVRPARGGQEGNRRERCGM